MKRLTLLPVFQRAWHSEITEADKAQMNRQDVHTSQQIKTVQKMSVHDASSIAQM